MIETATSRLNVRRRVYYTTCTAACGCEGIVALEVGGRTGSTLDAKVFEAWLDVDIFSINQ